MASRVRVRVRSLASANSGPRSSESSFQFIADTKLILRGTGSDPSLRPEQRRRRFIRAVRNSRCIDSRTIDAVTSCLQNLPSIPVRTSSIAVTRRFEDAEADSANGLLPWRLHCEFGSRRAIRISLQRGVSPPTCRAICGVSSIGWANWMMCRRPASFP